MIGFRVGSIRARRLLSAFGGPLFALACGPVATAHPPESPSIVVAVGAIGTPSAGPRVVASTGLDGIWTEHWQGLGYNERYELHSINQEQVALKCLTRGTYVFDDALLVGSELRVHKVNNPQSNDPYVIDYSLRRTGTDELCGTVKTDHGYSGPVCWRRGEPDDGPPVEGEID